MSTVWTAERMRNAKPKQKIMESDDVEIGLNFKEKGSEATIVSDDDLKRFPYQSVGRLFYTQGGLDYCGTAYVADLNGEKNTVITAAHNLLDRPDVYSTENLYSESLYFIPAMLDNTDNEGKLYGGFKCSTDDHDSYMYYCCPSWKPDEDPEWSDRLGNPKYDFGVIELLPRELDNKPVGDIVLPFKVTWDFKIGLGTKWVTLAYPCRDDNPLTKMMKQAGEFVVRENDTVKKYCLGQKLGHGASGGVWMLERDGGIVANGVHVVSVTNGTSWSPYFTQGILPVKYKPGV